MKYKISLPRRIFLVFAWVFCGLVVIICLLPLWHVLMTSLSSPEALSAHSGLVLWPDGGFDTTAYGVILKFKELWTGYRNTIFYLVTSCLVTVVLTIMGGYVFSRKTFKFRHKFMLIVMFTMIFNGGTIPTYMVIRKLGMLDTVWAIIIPGALSVFNILIMRTAMEAVPDALIDAARIDGAGELTILIRIVLPLCTPTIAVVILFAAIFKWNDYYTALLYLPSNTDIYPLQLYLREILLNMSTAAESMGGNVNVEYYHQIQYASVIVSTVPILCVYPFVQKYFVTGMTLGAVKE